MRNQITAGAEHQRYGHKIMFTAAQVDALRERHKSVETPRRITTGPPYKRWQR